MNPYHLRTFLAAQKHLNYTRAAEELFLSQPSVSRQIQQLEEDLGVALFEQIGKTLYVTDAGKTLVLEAERILGTIERGAEAVRAHRTAARGSLRIGASTTPGYYLLPRPLRDFCRLYPQAEVEFRVQNSRKIARLLVENQLDLAFIGGAMPDGDLILEPLLEDEIVCFAAHDHPLASCEALTPEVFSTQRWVVRERGSATRKLFDEWLEDLGAALGPCIELPCPEAIKLLVAAGLGLSFTSIHGLDQDMDRARFKVLPIHGAGLRRTIYIARHADKHISPAMGSFLELLHGVRC